MIAASRVLPCCWHGFAENQYADLAAQTRWEIADAAQAGSTWGVEIMPAIGTKGM